MARMNDDQLKAITDQEMRQAVGWWSGKLAQQRQKAMYYYLAEAKGDLAPPDIEGRSAVVSPDVRNTIEAMLPQLMVKFAGSETVVECQAQKPGDEPKAEQATEYLNYLYHVRNAGEKITYVWMKDALLSKNGIVKVWWDSTDEEKREEYVGLDQVELAQLLDDDEVEVTEQKSYADEEDAKQRQQAIEQLTQQMQQAAQIEAQPPAILYDVTCTRTRKGGRVRVENVPPGEFLISRMAKTIEDAPFVAHRVSRTVAQLKSQGYKNVDQIGAEENAQALNAERIERLSWDDEMAYAMADVVSPADESQRRVWVTECYIRCDYDGDGITELRRVVRGGNQILDNEIVDIAPFVSITPVPMPHTFFGMSVADLALDGQRINTALLRGVLDNTYLQINGRYFAVDGQVNLDDLLTSRPGGVVRVKQPGAAGRLDQGAGDSQLGMGMLEYMKGFQEESTGWSRNAAGNDPGALSTPVTATQATIVTNRADMRLDLIARNFAEGFRDLFRLMLKLVCQYQQKEDVVKLTGGWVPVNPREWVHGFDMQITVGLGTGNKDQIVQHLLLLKQSQQMGLAIGTTTPENVYEVDRALVTALGFRNPDRFVSDPAKQPPRPPPPSPEQIKVQGALQMKQLDQQADQQKFAAEVALK